MLSNELRVMGLCRDISKQKETERSKKEFKVKLQQTRKIKSNESDAPAATARKVLDAA
jgi:hypothetical protein